MNKAILIVICDFLVSAMLTMMTGMVPGHSGGTGVGLDTRNTQVLLQSLRDTEDELERIRSELNKSLIRESDPEKSAELEQVNRKLAENRMQQSKLRASLAATIKNTGKLDAEKLRRRLEEEQIKRMQLELALDDAGLNLTASRKKAEDLAKDLHNKEIDFAVQQRMLKQVQSTLADTSKALVEVTNDNIKNQKELARSNAELELANREIEKSAGELKSVREELKTSNEHLIRETQEHGRTRSDLAAKDAEARERTRELGSARADLRRLNSTLEQERGAYGNLQLRYTKTAERLVAKEEDNASLKDENIRLQRERLASELKAKEEKVKREVMEKAMEDAVRELSAEKTKLEESKLNSAALNATLEEMRKNAEKVNSPEKNIVFDCYSKAIIRIQSTVSEKAIFGSRTGREVSFYPLVNFGGKILLTGALNRFAGDWDKVMDFKEVTDVDMRVSSPYSSAAGDKLSAMFVNKRNMHMAGFEYNNKNYTALQVISAGKLQERGVEDLFLFKCTGIGANASLNGRVSLVMDPVNPSLFIRNAGRANNELNVEAGDIILTIHGEFVGIVSGLETLNGMTGGRVMLIREPEKFWDDTSVIPVELGRGKNETYYTGFGEKMQQIRKVLKAGYDRR